MFAWLGYIIMFLILLGVAAAIGYALFFVVMALLGAGLVAFDKLFPNKLKDNI